MDDYPKGLLNARRKKFKTELHKKSVTHNNWRLFRNCTAYLLILLCILLAIFLLLQGDIPGVM